MVFITTSFPKKLVKFDSINILRKRKYKLLTIYDFNSLPEDRWYKILMVPKSRDIM